MFRPSETIKEEVKESIFEPGFHHLNTDLKEEEEVPTEAIVVHASASKGARANKDSHYERPIKFSDRRASHLMIRTKNNN